MKPLFFSFLILLTVCSGNNTLAQISERLLEEPHDSTILYTGWYNIVDTNNGIKRQLDKSTDTFFIDPNPIVTVANIKTSEIYESNTGGQKFVGLTMHLDETGTESWSVATEKAIGKQLAFILDNRLLQVAKVNSQITSGVTALNRGDYSRAELENFKKIIESEK